MLKGRMAPSRNAGSAVPRSMTAQPGDGQELRIRQTSGIFDKADPSPDRDAKGKLDSRSWDLGVMRLERISLLQGTPRTLHRGNVRAGASAYLQKGTLPDLDFRILIASLDEGASEGFLTAILPCTLLRKSVLSQCRGNMVPLASWRGAILAHHLLSLARELPSVPMEHWSTLGAVTCTLVQACLVPGPGNPAGTDTPRTAALRERLGCIVRQNMNSPDFGPDALRRIAAMSRSKLYRIFEGTGGVARFIQDERLRAARQRLADVGDTSSIRTLASEVGFLEHSTFSRAFKLRYGSSPMEFREMVSSHHPLGTLGVRHDADGVP